MKINTGQLAFITGAISFLHLVNGISISHASLTPTITVTPSSNSVEVAWEKLNSWSSSSVFMISLSIPESVINFEVECEGGPGTKCVLDTKDIIDPLPSCTEVVVTVEASGFVAGPFATATLSPDPLKLMVNANQKYLHISWELPASCEKSSKVIIRAGEDIVHEEYLNLPKSSYTYELSDSISVVEDLEVVVKTVTNRGESRGLKKTLLYAERLGVPTLTIVPQMTSVDITFFIYSPWSTDTDFDLTISLGTDNAGDELCSQLFTCPDTLCTINSNDYCGPLTACTNVFVEVSGEGEVSSKSSKTLCSTSTTVSTEATSTTVSTEATSTTLSTEATTNTATTTTTVTSTIPPKVPDLELKPHLTSIDIIFIKYYSWSDVTDFTFTISNGTDNTGEELCASSYTCLESLCLIHTDEYCDPLPACEDAFIEVIGNGQVSSDSTKTSCSVTIEPTKNTSISTEGTSSQYTTDTASTENTKSTTITKSTEETTISTDTTTDTASTGTTKFTTTTVTSTIPPKGHRKCYSCAGCSSVDETTPVIEDQRFLSCVTKFILSSKQVFRGGSFDAFVDEECADNSEVFSCWCDSDLCNDIILHLQKKERLGVPTLTIVPHMESVDITFFIYSPWSTDTDFDLTISSGTDNTGDELCSQPFTCPDTLCTINSDDVCGPLPVCTNVFVEVLGEGEVASKSSKTLCSTSTTLSTEVTTTIPSQVPDLEIKPHLTSIDIIFLKYYSWADVTDFTFTISNGTDNTGEELCSSSYTCSETFCAIHSDEYCDPLPACEDAFIEVIGNGQVSSDSTKTSCSVTIETTKGTIISTEGTSPQYSTDTLSTKTTKSTESTDETSISTEGTSPQYTTNIASTETTKSTTITESTEETTILTEGTSSQYTTNIASTEPTKSTTLTESTEETTISTQGTSPQYTTDTASTKTTKSTTTIVTSTVPPKVPDLELKSHLTSIDIIFIKYYSWIDVTDFKFTISKGSDISGERLCSHSYTCSESLCAIHSDEYCDPLPSCTDVFVRVMGNGHASSDLIKTLCSTSPASTTAQYITETPWITETTDIEQFTSMSPETDSVSLSLIIGLSVGIPLALIAIAIVIYILSSQNKKPDQPMKMSQPRFAPLSVT